MEPLTSPSYQAATERRREMEDRLAELERAAAAAAEAPGWAATVAERLEALEEALTHHIAAVEAPDGLLADIVETAPRLSNLVQMMRDDHGRLVARVESLIEEAERLPAATLREAVTELLHDMTLHRQRGSDLVYEAFSRDIGGLDS